MKVFTVLILSGLLLTTGCASTSKNEEFKAGAASCADVCKTHPEVKEYSQGEAGGLFLILFGGEQKKCTCQR